jgi:eukaryotic-like serine/threonine-protein kinase
MEDIVLNSKNIHRATDTLLITPLASAHDLVSVTLNERYRILELLGEGGSGKTYRALDIQEEMEVAIKVLSLHGMTDWKTLELFEREAKILAQLDHPAIPRYLDFFRTPITKNASAEIESGETGAEEAFCLVQEIALGQPLTTWIEQGYAFSEKELQQVAIQILEILIYLQDFTPPIIHRDIKPQNILRTESGGIYLVDFGAVRDTYHLTITGGSTIVGTYGYMAPEQFRGQAVLATDLYGLGATLLYLCSGQDPADLPVKKMKIDFRNRVKMSADLANWLDGLLVPFPEDRYSNATLALDCLQGNAVAKVARPQRLIARISQRGETMKIVVPPIWLATGNSKKTFFMAMFLSLVVAFCSWLMQAAVLPTWVIASCIAVLLPVTPWLACILWQYFSAVISRHEVVINDRSITYTTRIATIIATRKMLPLHAIRMVKCQPVGALALGGGIQFATVGRQYYGGESNYIKGHFFRPYSFGKYLDFGESLWLAGEINEHLRQLDLESEVLMLLDLYLP